MNIPIKLSRRIAESFDEILAKSIEQGRERFGLCQYDTVSHRISDIYHADDCERDWNVLMTEKNVYPDDALMHAVGEFNCRSDGIAMLGNKEFVRRSAQRFCRRNGILVPYHTHPDVDDDPFSSTDGVSDTNYTFATHNLPVDIVVSANAWDRGIYPPVCATFNPAFYPYDGLSMGECTHQEMLEKDKQRGFEQGTHEVLMFRQHSKKMCISIDFVIEEPAQ